MPTDQEIDKHLDLILKASGSALRHYSMHMTLTNMRDALRNAMRAGNAASLAEAQQAGNREGDFVMENGNYENMCSSCSRRICRSCREAHLVAAGR